MNRAAIIKSLSNKKLEEVAEMLEQTGLKLSRQSFYQRTRVKKETLFNNEQWSKFVELINNPTPEFAELAMNMRDTKKFLDSILQRNDSDEDNVNADDGQFDLDLDEDIPGTAAESESDDLDFDLDGDDIDLSNSGIISEDDTVSEEDDLSLDEPVTDASIEEDEIEALLNSTKDELNADATLEDELGLDDDGFDDLDLGL